MDKTEEDEPTPPADENEAGSLLNAGVERELEEARGTTKVWERWSDWNELVTCLQQELVMSQDMLDQGREHSITDDAEEDMLQAPRGMHDEVGDMAAIIKKVFKQRK